MHKKSYLNENKFKIKNWTKSDWFGILWAYVGVILITIFDIWHINKFGLPY